MSITTSIPDNISFTTPMSSLKKIQSDSKSIPSAIQTHSSKMFRIVEQSIAKLEVQNTTTPIFHATTVDKPSFITQSVPDDVKSTIPAPVHDSICNNNVKDPVTLSNLNISTNDNTIDLTKLTTAVATAVSISSPVMMLKFENLTPHYIKKYIHSILIQMTANNYFSPLLITDFQLVSQTAAIANPTKGSTLYINLSKLIPPNTLKILAIGNNTKSDVYVIKNLITRTLTPKSVDQANSFYLKWCNIRRGHKESLEDYTAKAVQFQSDLKGTNRCIANEELVRK